LWQAQQVQAAAAGPAGLQDADLLADQVLQEVLAEVQLDAQDTHSAPLQAQQQLLHQDPARQQQQQVPWPACEQQSHGQAGSAAQPYQQASPQGLQASGGAAALHVQPPQPQHLRQPSSRHNSSCSISHSSRQQPSSCECSNTAAACSAAQLGDDSKLAVSAGEHSSRLQEAEEVLLQVCWYDGWLAVSFV
jgi:hypothetical protein